MSLDEQNMLVIGGQSQMDYARHTIIKKTCYLLSNTTGQWKTSS